MDAEFAIPEREFENRVKRTQELMHERGIDGLIAASSYAEREGHVCYLVNHHISFPNTMSHIGLGHAAVVLPAEGKPTLIAPFGYEADKVVGIESGKTGLSIVKDVVAAVKENALDGKRIGVAGIDVLPVEYYEGMRQALPKATFDLADDIIESQRVIKSPAELRLMREAARIADEGILAGMESVKEGVRECDIELAARKAAFDAGVDFIPRVRVSTGKKIAAIKWPQSTRRRLERGDFVFIDFIGWYKNYGFDTSRARVVGDPTDEQVKLLEATIDATDWMIEVMKPGVERYFVTTMARDRTINPMAHHIGIDICENVFLAGSKFTPRPNMVLCVEPGVPDPKFGSMPIEEEIIITETGAEVITHCPRVFW